MYNEDSEFINTIVMFNKALGIRLCISGENLGRIIFAELNKDMHNI